ncbi:MAG: hypothetical protein K8S94_13550 [Planctomycetia bacterium]|nr:hypothetical protein [Planctomycetia bacterium]
MKNSGFLSGLSGQPAWLVATVSLLVAAVSVGFTWYLVRRRLRNRPRSCPSCRIEMVRLGVAADDPRPTGGPNVTDRLQHFGHDVWTCPTCSHVAMIRYGAFVTSAARCPVCRRATNSRTTARIRSPSTWSSGLEEISEHCSHCASTATSTRVIPRLHDDDSAFWRAFPGE